MTLLASLLYQGGINSPPHRALSMSLPRISWWSARLFFNGWMGKLEVAHTEVMDCGFRRISMAIRDDKSDGCGVRGKSGGVLEAAA